MSWLIPSFIKTKLGLTKRAPADEDDDSAHEPEAEPAAPRRRLAYEGTVFHDHHACLYNVVPRGMGDLFLLSSDEVLRDVSDEHRAVLLGGGVRRARVLSDGISYVNVYGNRVSVKEACAALMGTEDLEPSLRPAIVLDDYLEARGYDAKQFVFPLLLWKEGFETETSPVIKTLSLPDPGPRTAVGSRLLMHSLVLEARTSGRAPKVVFLDGLALRHSTYDEYLTLDGVFKPLEEARADGLATLVMGSLTMSMENDEDARYALEVDEALGRRQYFWTHASLEAMGGPRLSKSLGLTPEEAAARIRGR